MIAKVLKKNLKLGIGENELEVNNSYICYI